MMKLKSVEIGPDYLGYGDGAVPGTKCTVELQHGERSYETIKITLDKEATKRIVTAMVAEAVASLSFDPDSIDVVGTPGVKRPVDDAPVAADEVAL